MSVQFIPPEEIHQLTNQMKMYTESVPAFRILIRGDVLLPGEQGYDEARAIWNGMFDRRPAIIARCLNADPAPR